MIDGEAIATGINPNDTPTPDASMASNHCSKVTVVQPIDASLRVGMDHYGRKGNWYIESLVYGDGVTRKCGKKLIKGKIYGSAAMVGGRSITTPLPSIVSRWSPWRGGRWNCRQERLMSNVQVVNELLSYQPFAKQGE